MLFVSVCAHVFEEFFSFDFIKMLTLKQGVSLLLSLLTFLGDFRIPLINPGTGKLDSMALLC